MVVSSLISMYSKCGFMDDANIVFEMTMKKDTVSWNAIIVAQAYHGSANKAAVAHCWGTDTFNRDSPSVSQADHYSCMIDILGRAGMLTEAYELDLDSGMCVLHSNIYAAKDRLQMLQRPSATNVNVPQLETFDTANLADDVGWFKNGGLAVNRIQGYVVKVGIA
ncbi:pentatricopeptide repeat-containing protein [Tanacetum coccineum]